MHYIFDPYGVW